MLIAIIAEYNPFHNGHLYQINEIKNKYPETKIAVIMSSSFVQRGEAAIIDKFSRAKCAIKSGVDLVIELPVLFSTQNAEVFAKGAVGILKYLNPDGLAFGCESDIDLLTNIISKVDKIDEDILKDFLASGESYIKAVECACDFTDKERSAFKKSNNILAMEYIKACRKCGLETEFIPIKRVGTEYNDDFSVGEFASASYIRDHIDSGFKFMPEYSWDELKLLRENKFSIYDIFRFKMVEDPSLSSYLDYEDGMENLVLKNIYKDYDDFLESCTSKRYSRSRIKRIILSKVLGLDGDLVRRNMGKPYLRVLAASESGFEIIKNSKEDMLVNFKNIRDERFDSIREISDVEVKATNFYEILKGGKLNRDFTENFIK